MVLFTHTHIHTCLHTHKTFHTNATKSQETDKSNTKIQCKIRIPFLILSTKTQDWPHLTNCKVPFLLNKHNKHHLTIICRIKQQRVASCSHQIKFSLPFFLFNFFSPARLGRKSIFGYLPQYFRP